MAKDTPPATIARLSTDEVTARRIAGALSETLDLAETAVALFEEPAGHWAVEVTFSNGADTDFLSSIIAQAAGAGAVGALTFQQVADRDWIAASLAELRPVGAGRFVVHGGHDRAAIQANRIGIEIEAALAFGTGHHGTRRGCLLALDAIIKRSDPAWRNAHILDLGTGSAVLAIAAAKALHASVIATDIDLVAVHAARTNARLNGVSPWITTIATAGLRAARIRDAAPYRIILANILLAPLKNLAVELARLAAPGGHMVISGLLANQANAARAIYATQGLILERRIILDGWATLVFRRAGHPARQRPSTGVRLES